MENADNILPTVSWNTTKVENGFQFRVYSIDYGVPTVTHKTGVLPTRAQAVGYAKKWVRYVKSQQR